MLRSKINTHIIVCGRHSVGVEHHIHIYIYIMEVAVTPPVLGEKGEVAVTNKVLTTISIVLLIGTIIGLLIWVIVVAVRNANQSSDDSGGGSSQQGTPDYLDDPPVTGSDTSSSSTTNPDPEAITTSSVQLRIRDQYDLSVASIGVWDRSGNYLGATDEQGNVTVSITHREGLATTPITVDGEGISPDGTAYHCTVADISLTPTGLTQRQTVTLVGSASHLRYNGKLSRMEKLSQFLRGDNSVANATDGQGNPMLVVRYSFVQEGQLVESSGLRALRLGEHVDGHYAMTEQQFKDEIHAGFAEWNEAFAALWPGRRVMFLPVDDPDGAGTKTVGDESGNNNPTVVYGSYTGLNDPTNGNMGDIRISMIPMASGSPVLAYAYGPWNTGQYADVVGERGSFGSDMMFNAGVDWRRDVEMQNAPAQQRDGYSVRYVFEHEFGHALGLGHDASAGALMGPYANEHDSIAERFPGGIVASPSDMTALFALYDAPTSDIFELRMGNCEVRPEY